MFQTKRDVDKHVRAFLSKLQNDEEKNLRGQRIAALYFNIGEYSTALEYLQRYIKHNDQNPDAYKLLGQCYEKLKLPDKQLFAYQRSLELDKKQTDLLVEVCRLLQNNEFPGVTPAKARYWYELAESRNLKVASLRSPASGSGGGVGGSSSGMGMGSAKGKGSRKQQPQQSHHHNYDSAAQNLSLDSFVSANGRSDLDDSIGHHHHSRAYLDRDTDNATPIPPPAAAAVAAPSQGNFNNIERLCRQMMESLNILKEDVAEVRNRVQSIEEQLNERGIGNGDDDYDGDDDLVDVEDAGLDYMDDFRDVKRNQQQHFNNTSMMANVSSRNQTFSKPTPKSSKGLQMNVQSPDLHAHQMQQQQQMPPTMPPFHHGQGPMGMQNPYLLSPMMNNMYGQFSPMNPYQTALAAMAANGGGQGPGAAANFPYGADVFSLQQQLIAQHLAANSNPRASPGLLASLLQASTSVPTQPPPQQQQQQQQQVPAHSIQQPMPVPVAQPYAVSTTPISSPMAKPTYETPKTTEKVVPAPAPVAAKPSPNFSFGATSTAPATSTVPFSFGGIQSSSSVPAQSIQQPTPVAHSYAMTNPLTTSVAAVASSSAAPTPAVQKSIFGSSSITKAPASSTPISSPLVKPTTNEAPKAADKSTTEAATTKASPFAAFSFGKPVTSVSFALGGAQPHSRFSFNNIGQSLANATSPETSSTATANVTSTTPTTAANTSSGSVREPDDEDNLNFKPTAHFEPVIELPALVEVKTGEENETVLFEHRAKLLRYVKETKEWKERGIGNMKVMVQKDDPSKVRLLMRREQVLKICCNQMLTKDMIFKKMPNTETALTWFGQDYSENELQLELLAIRFKTAETCKQFHDAILAAQAKMGSEASAPATASTAKTTTSAKASSDSKVDAGFGDKFKPKAGAWSCKACYTSNTADAKYCACCEEPKDDTVPKKGQAISNQFSFGNANAPKFNFGTLPTAVKVKEEKVDAPAKTGAAAAGFGDKFKPKPGAWSCKSCYTSNTADAKYCACCEEPKDDTVPKKGQTITNQFSFGNANAPKFNFGTLTAPVAQAKEQEVKTEHEKENCPGCRGCTDDFVFPEVKDTNFSQFDDNPLPLVPPPKVDMTQHNDLSKDTKKPTQSIPFSLNSSAGGNGFSFGTAIAAATAATNTTTNSTQPSGMFFGNSSFSFNAAGAQDGSANGDSKNGSLFGGSANKPTVTTTSTAAASAETIKPAFSFGSSSAFGASKVETSAPSTEQPASGDGDAQKPSSTTTSLFGGFTGTSFADLAKTNSTTNNSANAKSEPFSFSLTQNSSNGGVDSKSTTAAPVFGASSGMSFADLAKSNSTTTNSTTTNEPFGFAALAQNSSNGGTTQAFGQSPGSGKFIGLSNRDTFSNLMSPQNAVNGTAGNDANADDANENADDANYDPHYDPIIALPDEIQVSTGEENEVKLFGERAKLYRFDFDNKEWKERGVGEFKILHHVENDSYRLLLRREQIHKLVLNMALNGDIKISPMKQSDKAFCWVGPNYAENSSEGETESLSVRFKNADLASQFNTKVQECITKLKERESQ